MMKVTVNVIVATAPVDNESDSDPKLSRYKHFKNVHIILSV